jgi:hypothetical protein
LAVASEPYIFWKGDGADKIISDIPIPKELGHLEPADPMFNGPYRGKNDLFVMANSWMVKTFNSPQDVIQYNDKEAGIIKGKFLIGGSLDYI